MNTKKYYSCSFFGHSEIEISDKLILSIEQKIESLILERQINVFYFGGFGKFDDLCYKIVSKLKNKYPKMVRVFCLTEEKHLNKLPKHLIGKEYENFEYFSLDYNYWYYKIYYRNKKIIENSDYIIFYVEKTINSGAFKALKFAKQIKKEYFNFATIKNCNDD